MAGKIAGKKASARERETRKRGRTERLAGAGERGREIGGSGEKGGRERGWFEGPRV